MQNINYNKKQLSNNPFQPPNAHLPQTVGTNYGDRTKYQKAQQVSPTAPQPRAPQDQFNKDKKVNASQFASNVDYKTQRRFASAYKPTLLDAMEHGSIPRAKKTGIPSDEKILNFLDRVINTQPPPLTRSIAARTAPTKAQFIKPTR